MKKLFLLIICSLFVFVIYSACNNTGSSPEAAAPVLKDNHSGGLAWQRKDCFLCHYNLTEGHDESLTESECSECHGGNGACDPDGGPETNHQTSDDCMDCHTGGRHGFDINVDCVNCHYASQGVIDCSP